MADLQSRIAALTPQQRAALERKLAERAAANRPADAERILPRDRSRPAPLAFQQEREWAITQFRQANNIPGAFRVEGRLDVALLGRVLTEVVDRHEVLRSTVELQDDGTRVQVVHPTTPVPTPVVDLSGRMPDEQRAEVLRRWKAEVGGPFERTQPQRLRVTVLRMAAEEHVVLITTDHSAADLLSVAILVQEFAALYVMHSTGGGSGLPPPEIQYADFAAWQREFGEKRMADEVAYWRRTLDGVDEPLTLPGDRPFPARPTFAGAAHVAELPAGLTEGVRRCIEREKASLPVVLLAAVSVLLSRYLGRDDLVIGEIVSGRGRVQLERLIGCFISALPLRMRLAGDHTLQQVLDQAKRTVLTAYEHQDLPIERLIEELGLGREALQTSMTHVWIDVRAPGSTLEVPGLRISQEPIEVSLSAAPLTLDVDPGGERIRIQWVYQTDMFDRETIVLFAEQFERVLHQLISEPRTTVSQVRLTGTAPASRPGRPAGEGFLEVFQRRAAEAPYAPAVIHGGTRLGYGELDERANRLAHHLRTRGVGPETPVGILVDRSVRLPVSVLAVLKAGGGYLPLDPVYPPERIAYMLADAGAPVLITEAGPAAALTAAGVALPGHVVLLDDLDTSDLPATCPPGPPGPASLAYVVYTSGSTGRPKGAMIEHGSLATFARDVADRLGLGAGDRFLQFASPGFDVLAEELFPTWLAGGTVVVPDGHLVSGELDLVDLVERDRLTVMELPTAYWHEWVRELDRRDRSLPECLRLVIIGGERVLPGRLALWRRTGVPLMHVYGLTETTVSSTFFWMDPAGPVRDWPNFPIGTPLPSAALRVLDHRLRPVPLGGVGELYIGGVSVARGYLARPALTAARFVADPDPGRPGERLYRTGDLVRRRPDGNLEFLSRVDTQIKIRGFRVEPTEIESTLTRHDAVAEAFVALYEPAPGDRRLVAYVVPAPGAATGAGGLRRYLERELPPYLVPSAFVELEALPLNANGKVDRGRLPAPEGPRPGGDEDHVAPRTPLQRQLAEVVAAVVGTGPVGLHDNFFELGGDSILAIQVVARAREAGIVLSPYDLFANPTIATLAEVATAGTVVDAEQGDVTGPVPLTPAQRAFCTAGAADPHHHTVSAVLELPAPVDETGLGEVVERLLAHHDGLRQRILLAGDRTRARIAPRGDATPLRAYDPGEPEEAALAELRRGLDLATGPVFRVALFRPGRVALVAHRLVADPVSLGIIAEDLGTALAQLAAGREVKLPAKTTSWQSWARRISAHVRSEAVRSQRAYWSQVLGEPAGALPSDLTAEPSADTEAAARTVTVSLNADETEALMTAASGPLGARPAEVLLTALARTLTGWTGAARHVVEVERDGREPLSEEVDLSRTVGPFRCTHPVALPGAASPEASLKAVKESLRAVPDGGIGWPAQDLESGAWLGFAYRGSAPGPLGGDASPRALRAYPIEVRAGVSGTDLVVQWGYSPARHHRETVAGLAARFLDEVRALAGLGARITSAYTPSDFPLARVDQGQLDHLLSRL
ncbi:amino acid adenylation domain-containing protein [Actinoplanes sp. NPDC049316]|uniref:amino acid adenylation domain-containing protein n=1 Tax=Actinoplanes sp. NPDC049316 TaxID=3154727 RepID=UPI003437DB32